MTAQFWLCPQLHLVTQSSFLFTLSTAKLGIFLCHILSTLLWGEEWTASISLVNAPIDYMFASTLWPPTMPTTPQSCLPCRSKPSFAISVVTSSLKHRTEEAAKGGEKEQNRNTSFCPLGVASLRFLLYHALHVEPRLLGSWPNPRCSWACEQAWMRTSRLMKPQPGTGRGCWEHGRE